MKKLGKIKNNLTISKSYTNIHKKGIIILRKLVSAFRPHQYTNDMKKLYEKMKLSMYYYKKESLSVHFHISHSTFINGLFLVLAIWRVQFVVGFFYVHNPLCGGTSCRRRHLSPISETYLNNIYKICKNLY